MLTFTRRPDIGTNSSHLASGVAGPLQPSKLRWRDFNICPHCLANGRSCPLERLNEWGPIISRSDGRNFHLVMGDRPIVYTQERASSKGEQRSAGFWYVHEANGGSTETVVVILRKPHGGRSSLLGYFEKAAGKLFAKLCKSSRLCCLYEFDGQHLYRVVY